MAVEQDELCRRHRFTQVCHIGCVAGVNDKLALGRLRHFDSVGQVSVGKAYVQAAVVGPEEDDRICAVAVASGVGVRADLLQAVGARNCGLINRIVLIKEVIRRKFGFARRFSGTVCHQLGVIQAGDAVFRLPGEGTVAVPRQGAVDIGVGPLDDRSSLLRGGDRVCGLAVLRGGGCVHSVDISPDAVHGSFRCIAAVCCKDGGHHGDDHSDDQQCRKKFLEVFHSVSFPISQIEYVVPTYRDSYLGTVYQLPEEFARLERYNFPQSSHNRKKQNHRS